MRKYLFWILVFLLIGGVLSFFSQSEQGYVLIRLGNTTVETTIWLVVLSLIVLAIVLWFLIRFIYVLCGYPGKVARGVSKMGHSGRKKSAEKMLLSYLTGEYSKAEKYAVKFGDKEMSSALGQLVRIDAQIRQGKLGLAAQAIDRGLATAETKLQPVFQCLHMQLAVAEGNYTNACDVYQGLPSALQKTMRWQDIYWQALLASNEMKKLVTSLPSPHGHSAEFQARISGYYQQALKAIMADDNQESRALVCWFWKQLPATMQQERIYAEAYLRTLIAEKRFDEAEKQLHTFAHITSLGALMQYWGDFTPPRVSKSLKELEKIYENNNKPEWIGLGLGRLCLCLQLWGKAESYLRHTLDTHTDPEVNSLILITLARLYHQQGDNEKATHCLGQLETVHLLPNA